MAVRQTRLGSHAGRRVAEGDKRSPMRRLLEDCQTRDGRIEVAYDQQWRTLFKAMRLGLVDDDSTVTEAGKEFLRASGK